MTNSNQTDRIRRIKRLLETAATQLNESQDDDFIPLEDDPSTAGNLESDSCDDANDPPDSEPANR